MIGPLLAHLEDLEGSYAKTLRHQAHRYEDEHDVYHQCLTFAAAADQAGTLIERLRQRYGGTSDWQTALPGDGKTLLEDLRSLYLMANAVAVTWAMALQAAKALRDSELKDVASSCHTEAETQANWFLTRIKTGAPQALTVG
jgi:hypothetical protein